MSILDIATSGTSPVMQKDAFRERLIVATGRSLERARKFVRDDLPEACRYIVRLNQSYDGNPLKPGERVYPDDTIQLGAQVGLLSAEQVVELLWRDGFVPEWIDISVDRIDGVFTILQLLCCGRFTDRTELLYYAAGDAYPFGIKSPPFPPDWQEGDEPFVLRWRVDRNA
jgi:hypothetical protein